MENISFVKIEDGVKHTVTSISAGKPLVMDFWHTQCTRCPAALEKLDKLAGKGLGDVVFTSCALSLSDGDLSMVQEMTEDTWENLIHLYMTMEEKEAAKAAFGFKAVPFVVCFDKNGTVLASGDPRKMDIEAIFTQPAQTAPEPVKVVEPAPAPTPESVLTFDEDF